MNFRQMDLQKTRFVQADLRNSDFSSANLSGAIFSGAHLEGCAFCDASIEGVDFSNSVAARANFSKTTLRRCSFEKTDFAGALLQEAIFEDCNFKLANLGLADLSGATFIGCDLTDTLLAGADLSRTKFLESRESQPQPSPVDAQLPSEGSQIKAVPHFAQVPHHEEPIPQTVVIRTDLPVGFERNGQDEHPVAADGQAPQTVQMTETEFAEIKREPVEEDSQQAFMDTFFTPLIADNRELIIESFRNSKYPNEFRLKITNGVEAFRSKFNLEADAAKAIMNAEFNRRIQGLKIQSRNAA